MVGASVMHAGVTNRRLAAIASAALGAAVAQRALAETTPDFRGVLAPMATGLQPPASATPAPVVDLAKTATPIDASKESERPLFTSPDDGQFDASGFLSKRTGFLPIAMPITEPAVGYGLAVGLTFFHSEPTVKEEAGGSRVVMPSTTVVMGAATENGTWAGAVGHLGVWNEGKTRYVGAVGYASLNLDWFGKGDSLNGKSISYTNDVLFVVQNIKFQLEGTDLFIGPTYRFIGSDSTFNPSGLPSGIPGFELDSQTSGLGIELTYDSLDHPFAPTRGMRANLTVSQQAEAFGGDFNYTKIQSFLIGYIPFNENVVLGLKANADFTTDGVPFYDLSGVVVRGLDRGRYMDNSAVYGEAELRIDLSKRWTALAFTGGGMIGSTISDFSLDNAHFSGGAGFRYLIAERYGIRLGIDLAYGDGKGTIYVGVGTGWIRP
ncbi:MAG: BamA/TamA family outer membrane protein [Phycisphaerales bacterium]